VNLRTHIRKLLEEKKLSVRKLAGLSGVRRQSIAAFLAGANLHLDNLGKILAALGQDIAIVPLSVEQDFDLLKQRFPVEPRRLKAFCRKHGIRLFALFGSILRSDFTPASDIDVLIEFKCPVSLFELARIEEELKALAGTGHPLDVVTPAALSPHIRDDVLREREVLYEEAA
jgi:predicted nucleotidyltransferase